jgi:hypothetical protein
MAVAFHLGAGGFPPLLPVLGDDIRQQRLDLVDRGAAVQGAENHLDHIEVMERGLTLESVEIEMLADEDVLATDGFEGFGREDQIHGMVGLGRKINVEPAEDAIEGGDAAKAPALVVAKTGLDELHQGLDVAGLDFSAGDQFIEFFFHLRALGDRFSGPHDEKKSTRPGSGGN